MTEERSSGILLHISSLPGKEGIGTLGENAYRFIDFLAETNQKLWQILPLGPVGYGNSPYQCYSAFAGNPLFIDLDLLKNESLLTPDDLENVPLFSRNKVEFARVEEWKYPLLRKAFDTFRERPFEDLKAEYYIFLNENSWWLNDYTLFMAVKSHFNGEIWMEWEDDIKFRTKQAVDKYRGLLSEEIDFRRFMQFLFFRQWLKVKQYANSKGIQTFGDLPLYVSTDSADVWANTDIFELDKELKPIKVGGVPPDYFSETGQLWGNPVFKWKEMHKRGFDWWMARLHFELRKYDLVRIDHFRGLEAFWSVDAGEETAMNGKWVPAYGHQMLTKLKGQINALPLIAEDLGVITPEVEKLRDDFNLPGMKVLQFAFGSDPANKDLPHNYTQNFVVYTGTHDNNTTLGWLKSLEGEEKKQVKRYIGKNNKKALRKLIEMAWGSCANMAVIPLQDLLELDEKARMNTPGIASGNWDWRFRWTQLRSKYKRNLKELTEKYNR